MEEHVLTYAQLEEEQMAEPMKTLVSSTSQPTRNDHCNDIGNNEIHISIITTHLYLYNCLSFCRRCPFITTSMPY